MKADVIFVLLVDSHCCCPLEHVLIVYVCEKKYV